MRPFLWLHCSFLGNFKHYFGFFIGVAGFVVVVVVVVVVVIVAFVFFGLISSY